MATTRVKHTWNAKVLLSKKTVQYTAADPTMPSSMFFLTLCNKNIDRPLPVNNKAISFMAVCIQFPSNVKLLDLENRQF